MENKNIEYLHTYCDKCELIALCKSYKKDGYLIEDCTHCGHIEIYKITN